MVICDPLLYEQPLGHDGVTVPPPDGLTLVVSVYEVEVWVKFAVTLLLVFMITYPGEPPVKEPLNPVNWYPALAAAVTVTCVPLLYQLLAGYIVPLPGRDTAVVRKYCCDGATARYRLSWCDLPPPDACTVVQ